MFRHLLTCVYVCFTRSVRLLAITPNKTVSAYIVRTYYAISCCENSEKKLCKNVQFYVSVMYKYTCMYHICQYLLFILLCGIYYYTDNCYTYMYVNSSHWNILRISDKIHEFSEVILQKKLFEKNFQDRMNDCEYCTCINGMYVV